MDQTTVILALFKITSLLLIFLIFRSKRRRNTTTNLPPSPPSLPILGHLHLLKNPVHRTLQALSQKYGHVISLRFGSRLAVIISSPAAVEECFTKNDIVLANRPMLLAGKHVAYNYTTMAGAPYGDHWRNLRRIAATDILSPSSLNVFSSIRKDEVYRLIRKLAHEITLARETTPRGFGGVVLKPALLDLTFNVIMRMIAGENCYGGGDGESERRFKEATAEVFEYAGTSNPGDYLPVLNWIGYNGNYERKLKRIGKKMDGCLQSLIDEFRRKTKSSSAMDSGLSENSIIHRLLSLQQSQHEYYSDITIKGFIMVMILGGTDTSAVTVEWAMSNLLNNSNILTKAREEIDKKIENNRLLDEYDISNLPYLQNIIHETLRLYPAAPLLVPHYSSANCMISGYNVPRGTMVMVNAWALHRDPTFWDDAASFKPERFESGPGEAHMFVPFGVGRRACPGLGLAQRVVGLTLGSLIQCFEWERIGESEVDMREGDGLTMPKAEPLKAMCKAREIVDKLSLNS